MSPFKKVVKTELIASRGAHGNAPETSVWLLTLECGHKQERTESKAYVLKARCSLCDE